MAIPGRPLFGFDQKKEPSSCSKDKLLEQLQTAVQLEWATIPVYLTSLYSIVDGCNTEIYDIIRSVVMQEMLHFTQAANILIALGKYPVIDSPNFAPKYVDYNNPKYTAHLPGKVLPKLSINLKKLSRSHVFNVFMGIELPQNTDVANEGIHNKKFTIGAFYKEISTCIEHLATKSNIFSKPQLDKQVHWPWDLTKKVGSLVPIKDVESARYAIKVIITQGEGADLLTAEDITGDTLAHFFKFEEIYCGHRLEVVSPKLGHRLEYVVPKLYAYTGDPIPFDADGVWPMRDNPSFKGIHSHTNCYTETQASHKVYRALLRKLQEVFSGNPKKIREAVTIMESLQVHAKKLMWTKYHPDSKTDTTCGPVWDYEWPTPAEE